MNKNSKSRKARNILRMQREYNWISDQKLCDPEPTMVRGALISIGGKPVRNR